MSTSILTASNERNRLQDEADAVWEALLEQLIEKIPEEMMEFAYCKRWIDRNGDLVNFSEWLDNVIEATMKGDWVRESFYVGGIERFGFEDFNSLIEGLGKLSKAWEGLVCVGAEGVDDREINVFFCAAEYDLSEHPWSELAEMLADLIPAHMRHIGRIQGWIKCTNAGFDDDEIQKLWSMPNWIRKTAVRTKSGIHTRIVFDNEHHLQSSWGLINYHDLQEHMLELADAWSAYVIIGLDVSEHKVVINFQTLPDILTIFK